MTPHSAQPGIWIGADRDAYAAAHTLHVNNYGETLGPVGQVSITPKRLAHPLRGRQGMLDALLDAPSGSVHVLCGIGGSGKTTLALAVAEEARAQGADVWTVSVADAATFDAHLRALAVQLGAGPERLRLAWSGSSGDAPDLVWELLDRRTAPWLLVIDNADDLRLLTSSGSHIGDGNGWIRRPARAGRLLITSRNHSHEAWGPWVSLWPLGALSSQAATELLLDRAPGAGTEAQAATLAERLGHLPLLLHQAGLYLSRADRDPPWPDKPRRPRTFEGYRIAFDDRLGELLDDQTGQPSHLPHRRATATWETTLDLLAEQGLSHARPLLRLLAHFGDAPIPYPEVLSRSALHTSALFDLHPGADLQRAVNALAEFGLIGTQVPTDHTQGPAGYTATLHPLVAEVTRNLDTVRRHRGAYLALAAQCLHEAAVRHDPRSPADWPFWHLTTSHLHRLLDCTREVGIGTDAESLAVTAIACIQYAMDAGRYALAQRTAAHATAVTTVLRPEGRTFLRLRFERARLTELTGDTAAAETEYRAVLDVQHRVLPHDDADTHWTRHALAHVLDLRGDLMGAEVEYRAVLEGRSRLLGIDHIDTLWTRHNLAWISGQRGDLEAAESEYRAVLEARSRTLGTDHPHTLYTRHALAWILGQRDDLEAATAEYQAVLEARSHTLGTDHPHTLYTRHALAWILGQRDDLEAATAEYQAVLDGQIRLLGENHPYTHCTLKALGSVLHRFTCPPSPQPGAEDVDWWRFGGGGS